MKLFHLPFKDKDNQSTFLVYWKHSFKMAIFLISCDIYTADKLTTRLEKHHNNFNTLQQLSSLCS